MTYPMLDNLRIMSEVLIASVAVLGSGSLYICFKLMVTPTPRNVSLASA